MCTYKPVTLDSVVAGALAALTPAKFCHDLELQARFGSKGMADIVDCERNKFKRKKLELLRAVGRGHKKHFE